MDGLKNTVKLFLFQYPPLNQTVKGLIFFKLFLKTEILYVYPKLSKAVIPFGLKNVPRTFDHLLAHSSYPASLILEVDLFILFNFFTSRLASSRMEDMVLSGERGSSKLCLSPPTGDMGESPILEDIGLARFTASTIDSDSANLAL